MKKFTRMLAFAVLAGTVMGLSVWAGPPAGVIPPNWKGSAQGTTVLDSFYEDGNGDFHRIDNDAFGGNSTFLGRFTGTGAHDLNLTTFAFVGYATWTAANGDSIDVVYSGQLFPPTGPPGSGEYPYGTHPFAALATLHIVGGTGRFANAQGQAQLSGAYSGDGMIIPVPVINVLYFDVNGSINLN